MQEYFDYSGFEEISPEVIEKKKIRRLGLACGVGILALFAVMSFWSAVYFRITAILGVHSTQALSFARHPFFSQLLQILVSAIMLLLPFFIISKAMGFKLMQGISFRGVEKGYFLPSVTLGVGFCFFSSLSTNYADWIFDLFGISFPSSERELPLGVFGVIITVITTAFFPAFLEELAMRGIVMGMLRKFGDGFAVFCSAFVFGIMHASGDQIVFAFLVGVILGFITVKTNSIWPAITVHFLNNFFSVAFSYMNSLDDTLTTLVLLAVFIAFMLLAVFSLFVLQKKDKEFLNLSAEGEISQFRKTVWFLTAPTNIIAIIVSLLIAFFMR